MSQAGTEIRHYLKGIEKTLQRGNATEHSYRSNLKGLLETLFPDVTATNEPKRITCGAPDYIIANKQTPLGYIETKDIGISLDQVERTDQMKRYLGSLANLILTDYVEFRWYVSGQLRMTTRLAKVGANIKLIPEADGADQLADLLQGFMLTHVPTVSNPKELATRMAALAQLIRSAIHQAFESEDGGGSLHAQMEGFHQVLLPDLTYEQFADMYAQTICYGLFAARCNANPNTHFTREHAAYDIPKTNPFLRKMFGHIAGPDLDERIVWAVDDLAEVLNRSDMAAILHDFGKRTRQEDPVVHFYETFLAHYDPKLRELRGVYYTPEPVVSYIIRSVDRLLKKDFGLEEGLADTTTLKAVSSDGKFSLETHKVQILDPATGTGTFLYSIIDHIYESFQGNKGMWSSYVSQHLLPRLFGFELLMAPYTVAHMKLGLQLAETGYDFRSNERLGVYLTNTLEEGFEGGKLPFVEWLAEEATAASNVKYDTPVMVVLGNPPYAGYSANKGKWIESLMQDYKVTVRAEERQIQRLSNDYVKFFRFAQWRVERTGAGILAFITDSGYLDGILFRDMRHAFLKSFSEIYIFNLHGVAVRGSAKASKTDENVFDITQGVAIGLFIKRVATNERATVHYADLWGTRESKYQTLKEWDVLSTPWQTLTLRSPHWRFIPEEPDELYESWPLFTSAVGTGNPQRDRDQRYGTGIKTRHDHFVVGWSVQDAVERVRRIADRNESDEVLIQELNLCTTSHFDIKRARIRARAHDLTQHVHPIAYRPFDHRYLVYLREFVCEPKDETMRHLLHPSNIALGVLRRDRKELGTGYFVARGLIAKDLVSNLDDALIWPLYLYPETAKGTLWGTEKPVDVLHDRRHNLSPAFITEFSNKLNMQFILDGKGDLQLTFGPEDILSYMYAIFHSPTYRTRYAEFLRIDFPRLPIPSNCDLFRTLCKLGERLVGFHLMEKFGLITTRYPEPGNNVVEKIEYTSNSDKIELGRVWINNTQFFDGISHEVWEFHIGGYQVCQKWLKDRKGRALLFDDIKHYQRIVGALAETITLMEKIDEVIEEQGGWPVE